jgi:hypothetical protein
MRRNGVSRRAVLGSRLVPCLGRSVGGAPAVSPPSIESGRCARLSLREALFRQTFGAGLACPAQASGRRSGAVPAGPSYCRCVPEPPGQDAPSVQDEYIERLTTHAPQQRGIQLVQRDHNRLALDRLLEAITDVDANAIE